MFANHNAPLREEIPVVNYNGVFRRQISLFEGVAIILSGTIGAGILGLPFAIAKVGVFLGIFYIFIVGFLMMGLNLLLGSIAVRTKQKMQIVGFAGKYLGKWGKVMMTLLLYFMMWGVLTIYIIGEGEVLARLFGGNNFFWSTIFLLIASVFIYFGINTIKVLSLFLSLSVMIIVLTLSVFGSLHVDIHHWQYIGLADLLFPYGVLLFAFHGTATIPEVYTILKNNKINFKKAIIISGIIITVIYAFFSAVVVGVTGLGTTEIATIGLGAKLGDKVFLLGNIFSVLAMGTSCLMAGLAFRDSLSWDFKISRKLSTLLVCGIPFLIFAIGFRGFIKMIDIVGGVFISIEILFILLMYWRAKQVGDLPVGKYKLHHTTLLAVVLLIALCIGVVYSVNKVFG